MTHFLRIARRLATALLCLAALSHAHASLGDSADSIALDRAALGASSVRTSSGGVFVVHQFTTTHGVLVRQYVSPGGQVVAISWEGPALPDLQVVLGRHYSAYLGAAHASASSALVSIDRPTLVARVQRLPRGLTGLAYLPELLPTGANPDSLR